MATTTKSNNHYRRSRLMTMAMIAFFLVGLGAFGDLSKELPLEILIGIDLNGPVQSMEHVVLGINRDTPGFLLTGQKFDRLSVNFSAPNRPSIVRRWIHGSLITETFRWKQSSLVEIVVESENKSIADKIRKLDYQDSTFTIVTHMQNQSLGYAETYSYDGRLLSRTKVTTNGERIPIKELCYDEADKPTDEKHYSGGALYYISSFEYDGQGRLILKLITYVSGYQADTTLSLRQIYKGDLLARMERVRSDKGLINHTTYDYDQKGRLIRRFLDFMRPNAFVDERFEYYESDLVRLHQSINPLGEANFKEEIQYDEHANWTRKFVYRYDHSSPPSTPVFTPASIEERRFTYFR